MSLTEKQLKFVELYTKTFHKQDSAKAAGYKAGAAVRANENLRNPEIVAEIRRRVELSFIEVISEARDQLVALMRSGGKNDAIKLKATESVLDRAGLLVQKFSEHHVVVDHSIHVERKPASAMLLWEFKRLAARLAIDLPDDALLLEVLSELDRPMKDVTPPKQIEYQEEEEVDWVAI